MNEPTEPVKQYLDQNLPVLNSEARKYVVGYLGEEEMTDPEAEAGEELDDLVAEIEGKLDSDEETLRLRLYHSDLPKLDDNGLVTYDRKEEYVEITEKGMELANWMSELGLGIIDPENVEIGGWE